MEQHIQTSLEQINNPILVILLVVLMLAVLALWWQLHRAQTRLYELATETVGALKDVSGRLDALQKQHDHG